MFNFIQQNLEEVIAPTNEFPNRKFIVINKLGKGGEGSVELVQIEDWGILSNKEVALKKSQLFSIKQHQRDFLKDLMEYQNSEEEQRNPCNIIKVFDYFQQNEYFFTVMERGNLDLFRYLSQKKDTLTLEEKLNICFDVTLPINFLHQKKKIHRDIKPENYILVENKFKLIDFGLARETTVNMSIVAGTLQFSAPEMIENSKDYTEKVDVWSLACVFYEILTGIALFNFQTYHEIKRNILNHKQNQSEIFKKVQSLNVYQEIKDLLINMLKPNENERYSSLNVLVTLKQIIANKNQQKNDDNTSQQKMITFSETSFQQQQQRLFTFPKNFQFSPKNNQPLIQNEQKPDKQDKQQQSNFIQKNVSNIENQFQNIDQKFQFNYENNKKQWPSFESNSSDLQQKVIQMNQEDLKRTNFEQISDQIKSYISNQINQVQYDFRRDISNLEQQFQLKLQELIQNQSQISNQIQTLNKKSFTIQTTLDENELQNQDLIIQQKNLQLINKVNILESSQQNSCPYCENKYNKLNFKVESLENILKVQREELEKIINSSIELNNQNQKQKFEAYCQQYVYKCQNSINQILQEDENSFSANIQEVECSEQSLTDQIQEAKTEDSFSMQDLLMQINNQADLSQQVKQNKDSQAQIHEKLHNLFQFTHQYLNILDNFQQKQEKINKIMFQVVQILRNKKLIILNLPPNSFTQESIRIRKK